MNYKVFKQIDGRKTYVAVVNATYSDKQVMQIAKAHFKCKSDEIVFERGGIIDNDLYLDSTPGIYPKKFVTCRVAYRK